MPVLSRKGTDKAFPDSQETPQDVEVQTPNKFSCNMFFCSKAAFENPVPFPLGFSRNWVSGSSELLTKLNLKNWDDRDCEMKHKTQKFL